jgi:Zn-dependent protease with chaperone function
MKIYKYNTPEINAYTFDNKIFVSTGAIKKLSENELIAVMFHEYGHIVDNHEQKANSTKIFSMCMTAVIASILSGFLPYGNETKIRLDKLSVIGSFISIALINKYQSQPMELIADSISKKYGYQQELKSALSKMEAELDKYLGKQLNRGIFNQKLNLSDEKLSKKIEEYKRRQNKWDILNNTHPLTKDRIEKLS